MRFLYIFTAGFFLMSGVFMNVPPCTVMATPAPQAVEKETKETSKHSKKITDLANERKQSTQPSPANAETQGEKSVQSREIIDSANEKKQSAQNSSAEKPEVPPASAIDYTKIIGQQLSEFVEHDFAKNIAALPLKPIATIAISNLRDGLKKAFFIGDKVYPGFSTLAKLFISSSIGGSNCPGVEPNVPCYVLLFPNKEYIVSPLVCFKAKPESLIVKNLQSEANKNGDWQLISPTTITEKAYNIWMAAPKSLFSALKDFSTVTALFAPTKEPIRNLLSVDFDIESLSAFMPLPVLKLVYDAYIKRDFEKIIYALDVDEKGKQLQISLRHQVKPQTPWSVFCKAINERKKTFRSLNFPSDAAIQTVLCWDPTGLKNLLKSLSGYAKEAEWKTDPIARQVYRWGQLLYPLLESYLNFMETASIGNGQTYRFKTDWFALEEVKPSVTDKMLVDFLDKFIKKCAYQLALANNEHLWGSECLESVSFGEKFLTHEDYGNIHRCGLKIRGDVPEGQDDPNEFLLFVALYKGYLLYANNLERMASVPEQMKTLSTFSYCSHPDVVTSSRVEFEHPKGIIETSCNAEVAPETFVSTVSIPLSFLETAGSLIFGNTGSDKPKDKSKDKKETEKTNKSNVTNEPSNVSEPTRAPEGVQNVSDPAIPAQPAAVR